MRSASFTTLFPLALAIVSFANIQQLPGQSSRLVLPGENLSSVEFNQTPFGDALDYLRAKANESLARNNRSLNIVLIDPDGEFSEKEVSLQLSDVPWATALKYTCDLAGLFFEADYGTIVVGEKAAVQNLRLSRTKIRHTDGSAPLVQRLGEIPMTDIEFSGARLSEIVEFLHAKVQATNVRRRPAAPINLIIKESAQRPVADRPVTLKLARAPLAEVLHFATGIAGCRFRIDPNAVVIGEAADIARTPRPRLVKGSFLDWISKVPVSSVEIAAGTPFEDCLALIRQYSQDRKSLPDGINFIDSTSEELKTWSKLTLDNVRLIDLMNYIAELTGTTYRIESSAIIFQLDPQVKERPGQNGLTSPASSGPSNTGGLKFDP